MGCNARPGAAGARYAPSAGLANPAKVSSQFVAAVQLLICNLLSYS